jgi:hypothetical protein
MTRDDFEPLEIADDAGDELVSIEDFVTHFCEGVVSPDALPVAPPLSEQLAARGWLPRAPARVSLEARFADRAAAEESPCPECGRHGLEYRPFHRADRYKAIAACRGCGAETEF